MTTHDEIAGRIADIFIDAAYTMVAHQPQHWAVGTPMAIITPDSLRQAITEALAAFAREYGLEPKDGKPGWDTLNGG